MCCLLTFCLSVTTLVVFVQSKTSFIVQSAGLEIQMSFCSMLGKSQLARILVIPAILPMVIQNLSVLGAMLVA